jgi:hypothetical protein
MLTRASVAILLAEKIVDGRRQFQSFDETLIELCCIDHPETADFVTGQCLLAAGELLFKAKE